MLRQYPNQSQHLDENAKETHTTPVVESQKLMENNLLYKKVLILH